MKYCYMNKKGFVSIVGLLYLLILMIVIKKTYLKIDVHHHLITNQNHHEIYLIQYAKKLIQQETLLTTYQIKCDDVEYFIECEENKFMIHNDFNTNQLVIEYDEISKEIMDVYYR